MCSGGGSKALSSKEGDMAAKRVTHNVIEKKRKDRLKMAIQDIRKIMPVSVLFNKKLTHCDVLEKAGEYIKELENENQRLLTGDNCDIRAEIIAKLRKEKEDLTKEKQQLIEIIEASGAQLATANWKTKSNGAVTSNSDYAAQNNYTQKSGDTGKAVKEVSITTNESSSDKSSSSDSANGSGSKISSCNCSNALLDCEICTLSSRSDETSLVSHVSAVCSVNSSVLNNAQTTTACDGVQPPENSLPNQRKQKRTINHYLAKQTNSERPVVVASFSSLSGQPEAVFSHNGLGNSHSNKVFGQSTSAGNPDLSNGVLSCSKPTVVVTDNSVSTDTSLPSKISEQVLPVSKSSHLSCMDSTDMDVQESYSSGLNTGTGQHLEKAHIQLSPQNVSHFVSAVGTQDCQEKNTEECSTLVGASNKGKEINDGLFSTEVTLSVNSKSRSESSTLCSLCKQCRSVKYKYEARKKKKVPTATLR